MKKNIIISLASLAALVILMPACTPNAPSEDKIFLNEMQVTELISDGTLYNINDFLDKYMSEPGNFLSPTTPYRTRSNYGDLYLFNIDTIASNGEGVYLRGRIVTDDYGGNFYKSLVIQQTVDWNTGETIDQQCLRVSVDMGSVNGLYHQGQEIIIRCNGLAIGRYANQPQLCTPSYNNNLYANKASEKAGWDPGRIPSPKFRKAAKLIGKPDVSKIVYDEIDLSTLKSKYLDDFEDVVAVRKIDARAVKLTGVYFNGKCDRGDCVRYNPETGEGNPEIKDSYAYVFAPTTANMNYPQARYVSDGTNTIKVSTSEYAKYAHYYLPEPKYVGSIIGILGYYFDDGSKTATIDNWAISPFGLDYILPEAQMEGADPMWIPTEWEKGVPQPEE